MSMHIPGKNLIIRSKIYKAWKPGQFKTFNRAVFLVRSICANDYVPQFVFIASIKMRQSNFRYPYMFWHIV